MSRGGHLSEAVWGFGFKF